MTYHYEPMTNRINTDTSFIEELRCKVGWHSWARWEKVSTYVKDGRVEREVLRQVRECVFCGCVQSKSV